MRAVPPRSGESTDIAPTLQQLADIQLITRLKASYVRCVDLKMWTDLERLFVDDFAFDGQGRSQGAAAFVARVSGELADAGTVHELHLPEIDVESPSLASAVWPFADVIDQRRDGVGLLRRGFGHYHETYVRTDGGWRINSMRITRFRVECESHARDGTVRSHVCRTQEELVTWLREQA